MMFSLFEMQFFSNVSSPFDAVKSIATVKLIWVLQVNRAKTLEWAHMYH